MPDTRNQIPTFDEVMKNDTVNGKIPSFADIMGEEPPKKKIGLPVSGNVTGTLNGGGPKLKEDIWTKLNREAIRVPENEKPEVEIDDSDPIGSISKTLLANTFQEGKVKGDIQGLKLSPENQMLKESGSDKKINPSLTAELIGKVKEDAFKTTGEAEAWLMEQSEKNSGYIAPNNTTANVAKEMIEDKQMVTEAINSSFNDLGRAAVNYYGSKDDLMGEKIRIMLERGKVPEAMEGNLVYNFLQRKPVQEWSHESHENRVNYSEQKENLFLKYPDVRRQMILEKIGQGREDFGYNNPILNLVGKKSSDEIVNTLVATGQLTEFDKRFYEKYLRPTIAMQDIPTPGLVETTLESTAVSIADVPKSVMDITGISDLTQSRPERVYDEMKKDYNSVNVNFKGANRVSEAIGHLTGVILPIGAEAKLLQGLSVIKNANTANRVMMAATFYHGLYEENLKQMPDNEVGAHFAALLQTGVYDRISKVLPSIAKNVTEQISPTVRTVMGRLATNKITGAAAAQEITNTVLTKMKDAAVVLGDASVKNVKMATEMGLATVINENIKDLFSGKNTASFESGASTFETMLLGGGPLSLIAARGKHRKVTADMYNEMVETPERRAYFEGQINKLAESDPEFAKVAPQYRENLKHLADVHDALKDREDLTPEQKKKFQLLSVSQKIIENKIKKSPDKGLNTKDEKEIAAIEIEKEMITNPEMGSKKFIEEMYDEELIPTSDRVFLENNETGKFEPNKVGAYLKYIAQQANNLSENWTPHEGKPPSMERYPDQIIEAANERWAKEIQAATKKKSVSIIMPGENRPPDIVPLKKAEPPVSSVEGGEVAKIITDNTWYRGVNKNNKEQGDKFYSTDESTAHDYAIDKVGDEPTMTKLSKEELPKNPLVVGTKEDLAETIGFPEKNIYDLKGDFDKKAKKYAQSKGHDAIVYESGSMDNHEMHIFSQSLPKGEEAQQPAIKKESDEKVSNPPKEKPADEGKVAETGEATETGQAGEKPPISEPPTGTRIHFERPATELSHRGLQDVANEFSLPDVQTRDRKSDVQLRQDALNTANEWAEKGVYGKNVEKLVEKAESGEILTDEQRVILEQHLANVSGELRGMDIKSPEYNAKLTEVSRLKDAGEKTRSEAGAALRIPMGGSREKDIVDFMVEEKDVSGVETLTDKQKETVQKEWNDINKAKEEFAEHMAAKEAEFAQKQAQGAFEKQRSSTTKTKKTHADHVEYRKKVIEDIREKLRKARGDTSATIVPYAKELVAIAPDVAKLVKDLIDEGVTKLADVVKDIHGQLKDDIKGITEKDVNDLIAGVYNEKKKTRSELAAKAMDLKLEANLINKLESLESGVEPKSEKKKIERNRQITELKKKIQPYTDLKAQKTKMANEIKEIETQLKSGDFNKEPPKPPVKLDEAGLKLRDNLIKLRQARELRLLLQQRQNEGSRERALRLTAEVANIPRTLMTIMDFSALLRQNLFFSVGHPIMTSKALPGMFKSFTSQEVYDRWFADYKESPRYEMKNESKLAIADTLSHDLSKREESFMSSIAEKIPLGIGQIVKGSERSYTMLLNKMRSDMFDFFANSMESRGVTFQNNPKAYKAMSEYINNATGRSDFGETLNRVAPVLNSVFFSPRLIASRVNMLTYWAQPRFWKSVPKEVRVDYFRNWISLLAVGGTILGLAQLAGADVEDDPRSSDFGKIKSGNTRWDIWGGAQPYVRVLAQVVSGERKSTRSGKIYELNGDDIFGETRGGVVLDFFRNKLAPVPGAGVDILSGRTTIGDKIVYQWGGAGDKEISIDQYVKQRILPMTITGTEEAMKDSGVKSLFTVGIPNIFGVGTQTYENKKTKDTSKKESGKKEGKKQSGKKQD